MIKVNNAISRLSENDFATVLYKFFNDKKVYILDIDVKKKLADANTLTIFNIDIYVDGDWKHDHLRCRWLMDDWANENNVFLKFCKEEVLADTECDWYPAIQKFSCYVKNDFPC